MHLEKKNLREAFDPKWVPLALRNLVSDPVRLLRAAAGIGFASFLVLMELGFKEAFLESSVQYIRALDGEVFMVSPTKYRFGETDTFPRRRLFQAAGDPDVRWARPLYAERKVSLWKNPETKETFAIQVLAFDPDEPLISLPRVVAQLDSLKRADTALMDSRSRRFLGPDTIGTRPETELAGRRLTIAGTFPVGPDFTTDGTLIMGDRNFLKFFPNRAGDGSLSRVDVGVVKLAPGADPAVVAGRLAGRVPNDVDVLTKDELIEREFKFQLEVSNVGPIFLLGTGIGFVVGMLISYQILFTDISDQLPQYATLKAIGYGDAYLMAVVLQQAVFYAFVGFLPAAVLAATAFGIIGELVLLPMELTVSIAGTSGVLALGMCVVAGVAAVRRVLEADPAEVF